MLFRWYSGCPGDGRLVVDMSFHDNGPYIAVNGYLFFEQVAPCEAVIGSRVWMDECTPVTCKSPVNGRDDKKRAV